MAPGASGAGGEGATQELLHRLGDLGGVELAGTAVLAVLVGPLLEELVFRGFLQPLAVRELGGPLGVLITSVVFAALHGRAAFLPILALSALLGYLMLRTQRLAAPFAAHALNNGLTLAVLFAVPGGRELVLGAP